MRNAKQVDPAAAAELFIIHDQVHEPMHDRLTAEVENGPLTVVLEKKPPSISR